MIKNYKLEIKNSEGISLLEILVVVSIFAALGILITRAVLLTLGGGKKSESLIKVRENLNYSLGVIERNLRNADAITNCGTGGTAVISYSDKDGNPSTFSCVDIGAVNKVGYIASGSARLTNDSVNVTGCSFVCTLGTGTPSSIAINFEAKDASASGVENAVVTTTTQIFLRNY